MFLTEQCGMSKSTYDYLNCITYAAGILFVFLFNQCFPNCKVWILIMVSDALFIIMTSLMLIMAYRQNLEWGIPDTVIQGFIFFLGTNSVSILAFVPMQCQLTYLVP